MREGRERRHSRAASFPEWRELWHSEKACYADFEL